MNRRRFLGTSFRGSIAAAGRLPRAAPARHATASPRKTVLSSLRDTSPYVAARRRFQTFLDYCAEHKIAGESTAILGSGGHSMCRKPDDEEQAYLRQVTRAWKCGIDTHMELMTHAGLFDFDANRPPKDAKHEGLWLYEPEVTVEQYQRYLGGIIAEGERAGVKFTGLTWPGCGCEVCARRYAELRAGGHKDPNPALWTALLNLAKEGKFRGRTVPCFFGSSETEFGIHRKASEGACGVYDLMPNARDAFGIWENNPARVDPDYYITADGSRACGPHSRPGHPTASGTALAGVNRRRGSVAS